MQKVCNLTSKQLNMVKTENNSTCIRQYHLARYRQMQVELHSACVS